MNPEFAAVVVRATAPQVRRWRCMGSLHRRRLEIQLARRAGCRDRRRVSGTFLAIQKRRREIEAGWSPSAERSIS
jgi:hypothetical protein